MALDPILTAQLLSLAKTTIRGGLEMLRMSGKSDEEAKAILDAELASLPEYTPDQLADPAGSGVTVDGGGNLTAGGSSSGIDGSPE